MADTGDVKELFKRVGSVEKEQAKQGAQLQSHGRELGEIKKEQGKMEGMLRDHNKSVLDKVDATDKTVNDMKVTMTELNGRSTTWENSRRTSREQQDLLSERRGRSWSQSSSSWRWRRRSSSNW